MKTRDFSKFFLINQLENLLLMMMTIESKITQNKVFQERVWMLFMLTVKNFKLIHFLLFSKDQMERLYILYRLYLIYLFN